MSNAVESDEMSEAERRKRSKGVYEAVIRAVDFQSGHMQPPLAKQTSVIGTLHAAGYGSYSLEEAHRAITASVANGDLVRTKDSDGTVRLGLADPEKLAEKIETNLSRVEEPRRDIIGLANRQIQQLRSDDNDE
ncbi:MULTISPECIES: hypothetical protein [Actinomycetes]|uniref:hypothetical protein n=1 Tax=Aeromicrobium tamlense TaxID=375541 RepID=UPI0031DEA509